MLQALKRHVPASIIASFTSHLAEFVQAGVPLVKSLELLQKEFAHPFFKKVLEDIVATVRRGESFSVSLRSYTKLFSPFYLSLVEAGESSGKLEEVLGRLAASLERELELRGKVGMALVYPAFIALFGFLTVIFVMLVIVPKISAVYADFGGDYPLITAVVLALSHAVLKFGWIFLLIIFGFLIYLSTRKDLTFLYHMRDRLVLRLPWIKKVVFQAEVVRFSSTLGMLIESGVPLLQAIKLATQTITNYKIRAKLQGVDTLVGKGESFAETMRQKSDFPEVALNLIWVGESTGNLDNSLQKLGLMAEKEVDRSMKVVTTLLEPLIIITVGLIVGVIVVSLLLPIFQMSLLVR